VSVSADDKKLVLMEQRLLGLGQSQGKDDRLLAIMYVRDSVEQREPFNYSEAE
jgi:hypothetical protein